MTTQIRIFLFAFNSDLTCSCHHHDGSLLQEHELHAERPGRPLGLPHGRPSLLLVIPAKIQPPSLELLLNKSIS